MTEAAKVSVALEVTGLGAVDAAYAKFQRDAAKAGAGAAAGLSAADKQMASFSAKAEKMAREVGGSLAQVDDAVQKTERAVRTLDTALRAAFQNPAGLRVVNAELEKQRATLERINKLTGVSRSSGSADRGQDIAAYGEELDRLRARFNPLFAIGQQYRQEVDAIRDAHAQGALSTKEMEAAISDAGLAANAQQKILLRQREALEAVAGGAKLTGNQLLNLSRQGNDAITMWLSGASAMQIFGTQAGQVYGALEEGPGGLRGSLKALGGTAKSVWSSIYGAIGPVGLALAGVTTAAGALWYAMSDSPKVRSAKQALESFDGLIDNLKEGYGEAAQAAQNFYDKATEQGPLGAIADVRRSAKELQVDLKAAIGALNVNPDIGQNIDNPRLRTKDPFRREIQDSYRELVAGKKTAAEFAEELAGIQIDPKASTDMQDFAGKIRKAMGDVRGLEAMLGAAKEAAKALGGVGFENFARATAQFRSAMGDLSGFVPDQRGERDKIETAYKAAMLSARTEAQERQAIELRTKALEELDRIESNRRAGYELDLRAIGARTAAEKAGLAGERERLSLADDLANKRLTQAEVDRRVREAETMSMTESQHAMLEADEARRKGYALDLQGIGARTAAQKADVEAQRLYNDLVDQGYEASAARAQAEEARVHSLAQARGQYDEAIRQQTEATARQIVQAQLEYDLVGKSAGETARLRAEFELLAQAKEAARAAGFDEATVSLTDKMKEQAAEIGRLTDATAKLNRERDLAFRVAQAGRAPDEARIAEQVRSYGEDVQTANGQAIASQLRYVESVEKTAASLADMKEAAAEAFSSFVQGVQSGQNPLKALMGSLAKLNQQLADQTLQRLAGSIFGTGNIGNGAPVGGANSLSLPGLFSSLFGGGQSGGGNPVASAIGGISGAVRSLPVPTSRPSESIVSAFSGQMLGYAKRFNANVDQKLLTILNTAAGRFDLKVDAISGLRPGDPRFHGKGLATDVQIYGKGGQALGNYQDAGTFRTYERFAQLSKQVQAELFPELEGMLRWGGYFSGGKGRYGALDTMHFDLGGNRVGMGGGSWANGLTAEQRQLFPGVESVGMSRLDQQRLMQNSVANGMLEADRRAATNGDGGFFSGVWKRIEQIDGGQIAPTANTPVGRNAIQAGIAAGINTVPGFQPSTAVSRGEGFNATGLPTNEIGKASSGFLKAAGLFATGASAFANGMSSGSPIGGAISGALAGAAGGPWGMLAGAVAGGIGGLFGDSEEEQRRKAAQQQWKQMAPQFEAFRAYVRGEVKGPVGTEVADIGSQFRQFKMVSMEAGEGSQDEAAEEVMHFILDKLQAFRDDFNDRVEDIAKGSGSNGPFYKAKTAVKDMTDDLLGFVDDTLISFGEARESVLGTGAVALAAEQEWASRRFKAVEQAKDAARQSLLSQLDVEDPRTSVESTLSDLRGREAGVIAGLQKFGVKVELATQLAADRVAASIAKMKDDFEEGLGDQLLGAKGFGFVVDMRQAFETAQDTLKDAKLLKADASKVPDILREQLLSIVRGSENAGQELAKFTGQFPEFAEVLKGALATVREEFDEGLGDRINALSGKEYFSTIRDALAERDDLLTEASAIGGDTGQVGQWFRLQAQDIVDGAQLTGDAFTDLITRFPELAGIVKEFGEVITETAAELKERLRGYDDRLFSATTDTSTESGALADFDRSATREREEVAKLGGAGMVELERTLAAERLKIVADFADAARERIGGYEDRLFAAGNDSTTLEGQLAAFDRQAAQDRLEETRAGGQGMVQLEAALAAERLKVIRDFTQDASAIETQRTLATNRYEAAVQARTDAESDLRAAWDKSSGEIQSTIDRLKSLQSSLKDFLAQIRLDDATSPLSGFDQFTEAQKQFRETLAKANAGDEDAQGKLIDVSQSYLDEARSYYASSEDYFAAFNDVEASLKSADLKAGVQIAAEQAQLDLLRSQVSVLIDIKDATLSIPAAIAALQGAIGNVNSTYQGVNASRDWGANPERNKLIAAGLNSAGLTYTGAFGQGGLQQYLSTLSPGDYARAQGIVNSYIGINRQAGGLIPGYALGGIVGNGLYDRDSVLARYAGGGAIGLAGGEMVVTARHVTPQTYPVLDAINRTGRAPANDDSAAAEIRELRAEVRRLGQIIASSDEATRGELRVGRRTGEQAALAATRAASRGRAAA